MTSRSTTPLVTPATQARDWARLARALWRSPVGVGEVGHDLRFVRVNPALAHMNGAEPAEHRGRTAAELLPFAPEVDRAHRRVLETGAAVSGVSVMRPALGTCEAVRSIRTFLPLPGPDGAPAGVAVVALPVPDALVAAEALVESAPEGVALVDTQLRYVIANAALAAVNGPAREAHLGRTVREVIPRFADAVEPLLDAVIEAGRAVTGVEVSTERPPGSGRVGHYTCSFFPVRSAGRLVGVGLLATDVTRLREQEATLSRSFTEAEVAADRARREVEQLGDVVRALSHDLKTPLAALLGHAQLLGHHGDKPEVVRRSAAAILRTGRRLEVMISDLAEMVRLEAGQVRAQVEAVDVGAFAEELRERLGGALELERVRVEVPPGLPPALAEPARLERILVNLLSNALKYGGEAPVALRARAADGAVELEVADGGPGIPPDELGRIFERFYRGKDAAGGAQGLGLGLYLVRLLAESQGGSVRAASEPGRGATFTVRLPAARGPRQ